jgi:hypothetical protein
MADDEWANNNQPHPVNCGNFTGQFWNVMDDAGRRPGPAIDEA